MNRRQRIVLWGCVLALLAFGGAGRSLAQDEPQPQQPTTDAPPKPAGHSVPGVDSGDQQDDNSNQIQPDETPLTGLLSATLGTPEAQHSYWIAGLQYGASIQSSGYGSSDWQAYNYFAGNFSLLEAWSRSQLVVNYSGGAYVSPGSTGAYQQVSLAQTITLQRWKFQIQDSFSYLPQSNFGFGGGTNLGVPGIGGGSLGTTIPGIGGPYVPNQTIYGGLGPQYSNIGVIQATYALSSHSSITASGAYGILNYINPGYIDTDSLFGGLGYNYALSPKDTIGVLYQYSSYHFPGDPQAFGSQVVSLAYSRKITGRMALGLYGGPQYTSFRVPVGTSSSTLNGYASASLTYALESGALNASYVHALSGGGGLLTGSILDQVTLSASRKLTRVWVGNINFGYAHNRTVVSSEPLGSPNFSSWYVGGGVNRHFGRSITLGVAYTASISMYNLVGCTGTTCGPSSNSLYQTVSASLQWRTRPFILH